MRLRTLPVSIAGVVAGTGCACHYHKFSLLPMLICLCFALIAQVASNFANEYYDYANGLDKKGREGYRRGVTEGDIQPEAMKRATYSLLLIDAALGCTLIIWGGWWLIAIGVMIAIFAVAYSAGPYPLSHHGLGDIAVVVFFGLVPVYFTAYVQTQSLDMGWTVWMTAFAIGLLAANVLIVNNYRDASDDREVGKHTTVVIFGKKTMACVYLINAIAGILLLSLSGAKTQPTATSAGWACFAALYIALWNAMRHLQGKELNRILKFTSILLMAASIYELVLLTVWPL